MGRQDGGAGRLRRRLRVDPGSKVDLGALDTSATHGHNKETATPELAAGLARLTDLQDRLWAEQKHPVLVVLQGIDAAGKDGTIRHVMGAFNPQGCRVTGFKVPTEVERAHDYLWRVHAALPGKGEIGIFNRSHYEDVLVVRVHGLAPRETWSRRYDQINAWERTLVEEGTTIVKFFLAISADEQRERFQDRVDDPAKRWKFRLGDLEERKRWHEYRAAFEEALERCSTDWAPWYLVPADRNWFRNLAVAEILADVLDDLDPAYPPCPDEIPTGLRVV
jgi:PPK2 family polyphosphate:nucleotide phosphotransferase